MVAQASPTLIEFLLAGTHDADGNVLAAGKVFAYEAGTTTPKQLYTDKNWGGSLPHPVILDDRGCKQAWGDGLYDFVIKNSDETETIATYEDCYYGGMDGSAIYGGTSSGAANTYAISVTAGMNAPVNGTLVNFIAHQTNSGAATATYNGTGPYQIYNSKTQLALTGGEIASGADVQFEYRSSKMYLLNPSLATSQGWDFLATEGTYVSATSLTIAGDFTAVLQKGQPFKCTNLTTKYGYILSSSFGAGVTTITLVANGDFNIVNTTITDVRISNSPQPYGFPVWFSYTPTVTGFSVNPTSIYRFKIANGTATVVGIVAAFGTSGGGSATLYQVTSPVVAKTVSGAQWFGAMPYFQNSGATVAVMGLIFTVSASSTIQLFTNTSGAAWGATLAKGANFQLDYEI